MVLHCVVLPPWLVHLSLCQTINTTLTHLDTVSRHWLAIANDRAQSNSQQAQDVSPLDLVEVIVGGFDTQACMSTRIHTTV